MALRKLTGTRFTREASLTGLPSGNSRDFTVAISSETPVERTLLIHGEPVRGLEVLDHGNEAVDLAWLASGNAPVLADHQPDDQIGLIVAARLEGARIVATIRFGEGARSREFEADLRAGIRRNVSVGYEIREIEHEASSEGLDLFRVSRWRPLEASIVSIPADQTVGLGRSGLGGPAMADAATVITTTNELSEREARAWRSQAAKLGRPDIAEACIERGASRDEFRAQLLDGAGPIGVSPSPVPRGIAGDLTARERSSFSVVKLMRCQMAKSVDEARRFERDAGLELEVAEELARRSGRTPRGTMVPLELLGQRVLSTASPSAGGALVPTDHLGSEFIDILRNRSIVERLGARILRGLEGNVAIPRKLSGSAPTWLASEDAEAAESDAVLDQVPMEPHDVASHTSWSRRLLLQGSPDVEAMVRADLLDAVAVAVDQAAIAGSGTDGQPTGIVNVTGVGSSSLASPSRAAALAMMREVRAANVEGASLGFAVAADGWALLAGTAVDAGSGRFLIDDDERMLGRPVEVSEDVPPRTIVLGDWRELIVGLWGAVDLIVDPFTESRRGRTRATVFSSVDIAARHPGAFCIASDLP